ncbi:hypothetical protein SDC9_137570 [bioreactor metagenome]|uniref:Uncharacterized protein n=1 Tax=bioreactor metagenome TaxID=1076179 RepID=A0A645DMD2_9ZZZZ
MDQQRHPVAFQLLDQSGEDIVDVVLEVVVQHHLRQRIVDHAFRFDEVGDFGDILIGDQEHPAAVGQQQGNLGPLDHPLAGVREMEHFHRLIHPVGFDRPGINHLQPFLLAGEESGFTVVFAEQFGCGASGHPAVSRIAQKIAEIIIGVFDQHRHRQIVKQCLKNHPAFGFPAPGVGERAARLDQFVDVVGNP